MNTHTHHRIPQNGFIQIIPMVILAVIAVTTFVVVGTVEKQQQDVRSRAASTVPGKCVTKSSVGLCSGSIDCIELTTQASCTRGTGSCCQWIATAVTKAPAATLTKTPTATLTKTPTATLTKTPTATLTFSSV
jgi:hypothetical protein